MEHFLFTAGADAFSFYFKRKVEMQFQFAKQISTLNTAFTKYFYKLKSSNRETYNLINKI